MTTWTEHPHILLTWRHDGADWRICTRCSIEWPVSTPEATIQRQPCQARDEAVRERWGRQWPSRIGGS